jgi:hypothetical protein
MRIVWSSKRGTRIIHDPRGRDFKVGFTDSEWVATPFGVALLVCNGFEPARPLVLGIDLAADPPSVRFGSGRDTEMMIRRVKSKMGCGVIPSDVLAEACYVLADRRVAVSGERLQVN